MTNPISKAIVKAAVAMGYGKKSDYKGSTVADVLEKFAAIAKDKGGSGGGNYIVTISATDPQGFTSDKSYSEIAAAVEAGQNVVAKIHDGDSIVYYPYFTGLDSSTSHPYATFLYSQLEPELGVSRLRVFDDKTVTMLTKIFSADSEG